MLAPIPVKRITPPTQEEFEKNYLKANKPVIITGMVNDWPALSKWNMDYFGQNFGETKAGVVRLKDGECDLNNFTGSRLDYISVGETVRAINAGRTDNGLAVASPLDVFPEWIKEDYRIPSYCAYSSFLRSRVFLGPKYTITSLHQDLFENLYVMVKGKKTIILFEPSAPVYPNSRFSKLPNHAQVDPLKPDYTRFPALKNAQPYLVELSAGETLFLPSFWWHHLQNEEESMAVSFWWARSWKLPVAWTAALYKKLRKI